MLSVCKVCGIEDWRENELRHAMIQLGDVEYRDHCMIHRKAWEYGMGLVAIERYKKAEHDMVALGIGSGTERILYYLANKMRRVYATDLYSGEYKEAPPDMLTNPAKYAPFAFRENHLSVLRMDGRRLDFPNESMDLVFSFSSIEHFGGHEEALKAMKEIQRVLRVGGLAVIATEFVLNDSPHPAYYDHETIYSNLILQMEMPLVEELDVSVSKMTLDTAMDLEYVLKEYESKSYDWKAKNPHIVLKLGNTLFTSVMLVFAKREVSPVHRIGCKNELASESSDHTEGVTTSTPF